MYFSKTTACYFEMDAFLVVQFQRTGIFVPKTLNSTVSDEKNRYTPVRW